MTDEITLSDAQKHVIDAVRTRLDSLQVDTSDLDDMAMVVRIALIKDIMDSKGIELNQALTELSGKFLDLETLAGEMMVAAEGTRH